MQFIYKACRCWECQVITHLTLILSRSEIIISNRKSWNLWLSLAFNILLENPLVKTRFHCIEVCFYPLSIKIKLMMLPWFLSFKRVLWYLFELFCPSSSPTFRRFKNNYKTLSSIEILWILFFNYFGIFCGPFGLFLNMLSS